MICSYCGRENENNDRRCHGCGAHLPIPVMIDDPAVFWEEEFRKLAYRLDDIQTGARNWEKTAAWVSLIAIIEIFIIIALVSV